RGLVDVDLVDAGGVHRGDGPRDGALADTLRQNLAPLGGQELGIAQSLDAVRGVEDDGGGDHGTEERAAADFVYAGYELRASIPCALLVARGALQPLEQAELGRSLRERLA